MEEQTAEKTNCFNGDIKDNNSNDKFNDNIIIANIKINKNNLLERIINSFENTKNEELYRPWKEIQPIENEEQIKECEIFINNNKINFNYYYKFQKEGNYIIKYKFKNLFISTDFMFYKCKSITLLDLSKFKTQKLTSMKYMFDGCESLLSLNLSNFNTQQVTDMRCMFRDCKSLITLDLSNFNTQQVSDFCSMFSRCKSLVSINLSNFNTENATNMSFMFNECNSLISLDLSNYNINEECITNFMFNNCNSLTKLDLSNFKYGKIINMFNDCNSLIYKAIKNFE